MFFGYSKLSSWVKDRLTWRIECSKLTTQTSFVLTTIYNKHMGQSPLLWYTFPATINRIYHNEIKFIQSNFYGKNLGWSHLSVICIACISPSHHFIYEEYEKYYILIYGGDHCPNLPTSPQRKFSKNVPRKRTSQGPEVWGVTLSVEKCWQKYNCICIFDAE